MKCSNCGADVSLYDLKCPYCDTPNPEGIAFREEMIAKRKRNEAMKKQTERNMALPVANLWAKRIFRTMLVLTVLQILFMILGAAFTVGPFTKGRPKNYVEELAKMADEEDYMSIYQAQYNWNLDSKDFPQYAQFAELWSDYYRFMDHAMGCTASIDAGNLPDSYDLEYAITYGLRFLEPRSSYNEILPECQKYYNECRQEVTTFFSGYLMMTDDELEQLSQTDYYDYDMRKNLLQTLQIRLAKVLDPDALNRDEAEPASVSEKEVEEE